MERLLHVLLATAQSHPQAALWLTALVAFAESLAIVGTLVPAAVVLFGIGALVGHGALAIWPVLGYAVVGAIAGDGISYELGRRCEVRVRTWRVFRLHEDAVGKAEAVLVRHGSMGVALARFTGPVRAFVPLLAGFARMPRLRFYATNVLSAPWPGRRCTSFPASCSARRCSWHRPSAAAWH